jgi:hypothetical protein
MSAYALTNRPPTAGVRTNVQDLLKYSLEEKKRNFLETVELQIGLKNYDPQRGTLVIKSYPTTLNCIRLIEPRACRFADATFSSSQISVSVVP